MLERIWKCTSFIHDNYLCRDHLQVNNTGFRTPIWIRMDPHCFLESGSELELNAGSGSWESKFISFRGSKLSRGGSKWMSRGDGLSASRFASSCWGAGSGSGSALKWKAGSWSRSGSALKWCRFETLKFYVFFPFNSGQFVCVHMTTILHFHADPDPE
jgi:hypothetical protein